MTRSRSWSRCRGTWPIARCPWERRSGVIAVLFATTSRSLPPSAQMYIPRSSSPTTAPRFRPPRGHTLCLQPCGNSRGQGLLEFLFDGGLHPLGIISLSGGLLTYGMTRGLCSGLVNWPRFAKITSHLGRDNCEVLPRTRMLLHANRARRFRAQPEVESPSSPIYFE